MTSAFSQGHMLNIQEKHSLSTVKLGSLAIGLLARLSLFE